MEIFTGAGLAALLQVVVIDLVLAGDNAVVIGLAANGLAPSLRTRAILVGILAATTLRILFATIAIELLQIVGLVLVGGFLLLWVCWRMWREIRSHASLPQAEPGEGKAGGNPGEALVRKTFAQAATQIVVADVSMSLDNVLAVAGAAREHPTVLIAGLALSIALMGLAASFIARLLDRYRWIAYIGLLIILYVALEMIYRGSMEVSGPLAAVL